MCSAATCFLMLHPDLLPFKTGGFAPRLSSLTSLPLSEFDPMLINLFLTVWIRAKATGLLSVSLFFTLSFLSEVDARWGRQLVLSFSSAYLKCYR